MAVMIHQIRSMAHLPLVRGVVCKLNVAVLIHIFCPLPSVTVLSCGRGVEVLLLAILDGHHTFYKVGTRLEHLARFVAWVDGRPRSPRRTATFVALAIGHIGFRQ